MDGETDWKHRKAIKYTQNIKDDKKLILSDFQVIATSPNKRIDDFKGYYIVDSNNIKEPLSVDNSMWANTVLATQGHILGMVVYTGNETKYRLNS